MNAVGDEASCVAFVIDALNRRWSFEPAEITEAVNAELRSSGPLED